MLRRSLLAVPAVAVLAAWLGERLGAGAGALLGAVVALLVAVALGRTVDERVREAADSIRRFAQGRPPPPVRPLQGEWRRLAQALNAVGASLEQQFEELAGERERIERLLDDLPLAVLLFTELHLAYANPAARRLFSAGSALGRSPMQVLTVPGLSDAVLEAQETGRTVGVEIERDGRVLAARASVTAAGEVALVVSDLTDARRVEAIRRDFVTNASHELKTPVAGIQALAESLPLAVTRDPQRAAGMLERLRLEAARLAQLVRDLLDLARLEEVTTQRAAAIDLAGLVRAEADRLARVAKRRHVVIRCDLQPATLVAVPEDIRLVVGNLLENAVQYNRPGGHVRVTTHRDASTVVLEVADEGIGIPAADQDRVFERFYRVDKGRSRAAGGTGLGLSLVRHAVQRHGGEVTLRSVLGEGSTFRVVLPVEGAPGASG